MYVYLSILRMCNTYVYIFVYVCISFHCVVVCISVSMCTKVEIYVQYVLKNQNRGYGKRQREGYLVDIKGIIGHLVCNTLACGCM